MSHEMRTPLSAVLGYAQLMGSAAQAPTDAQQRSLELILQAGWYLEKLIDTTRDLALIDSGGLSLSLDRLPIAAIIRDCQALLESQMQARAVRVIFPVLDTSCLVLADAVRVQQVLSDLLSAAIECVAVGGVLVVDCVTGSSGGNSAGSSEWIRISITDAVARAAPVVRDHGICVLLAKRLVALMGGAIGAQSTVVPGELFSFVLKRMDPPVAAGRSSHQTHIAFTAADASAANVITG
jgi:signal transduction histidine kinase